MLNQFTQVVIQLSQLLIDSFLNTLQILIENLKAILDLISAKVNQESIANVIPVKSVKKDLKVNKNKTKTEVSLIQFKFLKVLILLLLKTANL